VTSVGISTAEIAGDAAVLIDPLDVDAIAEAIERVLDDGALAATLAEKGRRRVATFTRERSAALTFEVYREAAGTG
jgi:alpha-1,3-rhamnosyl/mannosyltransferase